MNPAVADKVRKLLALSQSSNPHEAAAAAAAAERLMQAHRLSEAELGDPGDPSPIESEDFERMRAGLVTWRALLANEIARLHGCALLERRPAGQPRPVTLLIYGEPGDVAAVRVLYSWARREVEAVTTKSCRLGGLRGTDRETWRNSFRLGCVTGICDGMIEAARRVRADASSTALAVVDQRLARADQAVAGEVNVKPPHVQHGRLDTQAFGAGERAGRALERGARTHRGRVLPE